MEIYSSEGEHYSHSVCENVGEKLAFELIGAARHGLMRMKNKNTQCEYDLEEHFKTRAII